MEAPGKDSTLLERLWLYQAGPFQGSFQKPLHPKLTNIYTPFCRREQFFWSGIHCQQWTQGIWSNWSESNLGSVGVMEALVNITTAHYQDVLLQLLAAISSRQSGAEPIQHGLGIK